MPSRFVALARALGGVSFFFDAGDWQAATDDRQQVAERALDRLDAAA